MFPNVTFQNSVKKIKEYLLLIVLKSQSQAVCHVFKFLFGQVDACE